MKVLLLCLVFVQLLVRSNGYFGQSFLSQFSYKFFQNDYYGAMGLDKGATKQDIKKKYRELSKQYHPDRNSKADPQRFIDIAAAHEVLMNDKRRAKYDEFIASLPRGFRPVYGKERSAFRTVHLNPFSVLVTSVFGFLLVISVLQNNHFKRDRVRAFTSEFYLKALETAKEQGQSEEEFKEVFLEANPKLNHSWRDTSGALLLLLPFRVFSNGGNRRQEEEKVDEELVGLTEEEKEEVLEKRRQAALEEAARVELERKKALYKASQAKAREEKRQKAAAAEQARQRKQKLVARKRRINELEVECLLDIVEVDESFAVELKERGLLEDDLNATLEELEKNFSGIQEALLELVESDKLDEEEFWMDSFDEIVLLYEEAKQERQLEEQEAYEEEQRKALLESSLNTDTDDQSMATPEEEVVVVEEDDEWGAELEARERAKQEKKERQKEEKRKKAEERKLANEEKKSKGGKQQKGKKERRRR
mmetsp:Transcript_13282/g.23815  ORF Transcript_13282/g.23815 Transcript_13282/m.23815 type:complete len:479 (+) Transcript_13282:42-1478(+)